MTEHFQPAIGTAEYIFFREHVSCNCLTGLENSADYS
jgi:hypothetical protein